MRQHAAGGSAPGRIRHEGKREYYKNRVKAELPDGTVKPVIKFVKRGAAVTPILVLVPLAGRLGRELRSGAGTLAHLGRGGGADCPGCEADTPGLDLTAHRIREGCRRREHSWRRGNL